MDDRSANDKLTEVDTLYYYTAPGGVYEETPAHGTAWVARPDDGVKARRRALELRFKNYFTPVEILPPVVYRGLRAVKHRFKPPHR